MRFDWYNSAMKHEKLLDCLQVVRIYSFMKEMIVYTRVSHIVFLFVKTEVIIL